MSEILFPVEYRRITGPLIFLAGPIKGTANWQGEAIEHIAKNSSAHIACPRRSALPTGAKLQGRSYHEQVDWEHHYLDYAAEHGVIMFWLAKQLYDGRVVPTLRPHVWSWVKLSHATTYKASSSWWALRKASPTSATSEELWHKNVPR